MKSLTPVDPAFLPGPQLSVVITDQYLRHCGAKPNKGEIRSWERSIPMLVQDLADVGLDGVELMIEHRLPLTAKRADVILAGIGHGGEDRYVIVELKQWSSAELFEDDPNLVLVPGMRGGPKLHPALQANTYRDYLLDFTEGIQPSQVDSIAYLHYAQDGDVFDLLGDTGAAPTRMFTASRRGELLKYLASVFAPLSGAAAADRLEAARIRPTKQLLRHAAPVLKGRDHFVLLDEQRLAFELVRHAVEKAHRSDHKTVVIVTGGPGSGKSVIALSLLADMAARDYAAVHATGSKSFTETLRRYAAKGSTRTKNLFKYFNSFMKATPNDLDVLISDEAHRIRETSANRYTRAEDRSGRAQLDELISAARVPVFLLDEHQIVRPGELGTVDDIRAHAIARGLDVHEVELDAQYRCGGSRLYENWVLGLLELGGEQPVVWSGDENFTVETVETPHALESQLSLHLEEGYSARMTAGYCWKWSKPKPDGTLVHDVVIGDWSRPWNVNGQRSVGTAPPSALWATHEGGFGQVGCVYTAQGFEYDYNGVIIGPDLIYRNGRLITDRSANRDPAITKKVTDAQADRLIRNTYKVLLTRGLRGTLLYSSDPETQEYLASLMRTTSRATHCARLSKFPGLNQDANSTCSEAVHTFVLNVSDESVAGNQRESGTLFAFIHPDPSRVSLAPVARSKLKTLS